MRTGFSQISVWPLFTDPDFQGNGCGTVRVTPKAKHAYHRNSYGDSYYLSGTMYSPVSHAVKVCIACFKFGRFISSGALNAAVFVQAFKGMEAARSQPKSVASAKNMYDRLVVLKEHLLEKLQPKDCEGQARESTVWCLVSACGLVPDCELMILLCVPHAFLDAWSETRASVLHLL